MGTADNRKSQVGRNDPKAGKERSDDHPATPTKPFWQRVSVYLGAFGFFFGLLADVTPFLPQSNNRSMFAVASVVAASAVLVIVFAYFLFDRRSTSISLSVPIAVAMAFGLALGAGGLGWALKGALPRGGSGTTSSAGPTAAPEPSSPAVTTEPSPSATSATAAQGIPAETVQDPSCRDVGGTELLSKPWHLTGNGSDSQAYEEIPSQSLTGRDTVLITYDLHGLVAQRGDLQDQSAIIFDQPNWHVVSLADIGHNGLNGKQVARVPLVTFIGIADKKASIPGGVALNPDKPVGTLHTRIWSGLPFTVDISSICVFESKKSS